MRAIWFSSEALFICVEHAFSVSAFFCRIIRIKIEWQIKQCTINILENSFRPSLLFTKWYKKVSCASAHVEVKFAVGIKKENQN